MADHDPRSIIYCTISQIRAPTSAAIFTIPGIIAVDTAYIQRLGHLEDINYLLSQLICHYHLSVLNHRIYFLAYQ